MGKIFLVLFIAFMLFLAHRILIWMTGLIINHYRKKLQQQFEEKYEIEISLNTSKKTFAELVEHLSNKTEEIKNNTNNFMTVGGQENGKNIAKACFDIVITCMHIINYLDKQNIDLSNLEESDKKNVN